MSNNSFLNKLISNGDIESAKMLLQNLQENKEDLINYLLNAPDENGNTAFHNAVKSNEQDLAMMIYNMGGDLSARNNDKYAIELVGSEAQPDLSNFIRRLSMPIPDVLHTVQSTEANGNQLSEFKFIQNFLDKSNPRMKTNKKTDTIDSEEFIKFIQQNKIQIGGEEAMSQDTKNFMDYISQENIQKGGEENAVYGTRKINQSKTVSSEPMTDSLQIASELRMYQSGGRRQSPKSFRLKHSTVLKKPERSKSTSRSLSRPSSDLHQEVVDILKKNHSLSEDDARYIKAGLYYMIKEKFANLSNMQRALKLKELAMDNGEVERMKKDLPRLRETVEKARKQRQDEKTNSPAPAKAKKTKETSETKPKKTKEVKKEKKTKRSKSRSRRRH